MPKAVCVVFALLQLHGATASCADCEVVCDQGCDAFQTCSVSYNECDYRPNGLAWALIVICILSIAYGCHRRRVRRQMAMAQLTAARQPLVVTAPGYVAPGAMAQGQVVQGQVVQAQAVQAQVVQPGMQ